MPVSAFDLSVALFVRGLTNLKVILIKAEQQVAERGIATAELLDARLGPDAPDMRSLASQVHWAAEGAKRTIERLTGAPIAEASDDARTFADLQQRLDAAIATLQSSSADELEAALSRVVEIERPVGALRFTGESFLREFSLPHFFFHLTCAYAILRQRGVDLTLGDFLGPPSRSP